MLTSRILRTLTAAFLVAIMLPASAGASTGGASIGRSTTTPSSSTTGYLNPFAHAGSLFAERIDMGVDYAGSGRIDALGSARITMSATHVGGGWTCDGGPNAAVVYLLTAGADRGRYVYVAEDILPSVHVGQTVRAGQQIGRFARAPADCVEVGFSAGPTIEPEAALLHQQAKRGDPGRARTFCGQTMSDLLSSVGAPAGLVSGRRISGTSCPVQPAFG